MTCVFANVVLVSEEFFFKFKKYLFPFKTQRTLQNKSRFHITVFYIKLQTTYLHNVPATLIYITSQLGFTTLN